VKTLRGVRPWEDWGGEKSSASFQKGKGGKGGNKSCIWLIGMNAHYRIIASLWWVNEKKMMIKGVNRNGSDIFSP